MVPHSLDAECGAKMQDAVQLFADGITLLRGENHARVFSPGGGPLRVKVVEVRDVECIEDTAALGCVGQLFLVGFCGHAGVGRRNGGHATRPERRDKVAVHCVLVDVEADRPHWRDSPPALLSKGRCCCSRD